MSQLAIERTLPPRRTRTRRTPRSAQRLPPRLPAGEAQRAWQHALDRKGRLYLPQGLIQQFGRELVFAIARTESGPLLLLLPRDTWERRAEEWGTSLEWWRLEGSTAATCTVPAFPKVLLPLHLRELFGLRPGAELVIRVLGEAAEILPLAVWREEMRARLGVVR